MFVLVTIATDSRLSYTNLTQIIMNRYCIEVDRIERDGSIFHLVQYRELKATKTLRAHKLQLKKLTDRIGEELQYYQVPYKRYSVSMA